MQKPALSFQKKHTNAKILGLYHVFHLSSTFFNKKLTGLCRSKNLLTKNRQKTLFAFFPFFGTSFVAILQEKGKRNLGRSPSPNRIFHFCLVVKNESRHAISFIFVASNCIINCIRVSVFRFPVQKSRKTTDASHRWYMSEWAPVYSSIKLPHLISGHPRKSRGRCPCFFSP